MARPGVRSFRLLSRSCACVNTRISAPRLQWRQFQHSAGEGSDAPPFAFAFDIDGVLVRSSKALPRAKKALSYLQEKGIPFILLTNGGGKHESERVAELSRQLDVPLNEQDFVQSHTPFTTLVDGTWEWPALKNQTILVAGGDGDKARQVAESYGFQNVVTPADIYTAHPEIWPFAKNFAEYHASHSRPLPAPVYLGPDKTTEPLKDHLKIGAIFVYNDPRDWGLDATIILDLLLSHQGYLGTISPLNGKKGMPNHGYQQDGQPTLYFSNPDLWWAASWHLNRLGQGGFRTALTGLWRATTEDQYLDYQMYGKPTHKMYQFAEKRLIQGRQRLLGADVKGPQRVYMVGDNPCSDIAGANEFKSPTGVQWKSILVRTGVYGGGGLHSKPDVIKNDIWDAVRWAGREEGWEIEDNERFALDPSLVDVRSKLVD